MTGYELQQRYKCRKYRHIGTQYVISETADFAAHNRRQCPHRRVRSQRNPRGMSNTCQPGKRRWLRHHQLQFSSHCPMLFFGRQSDLWEPPACHGDLRYCWYNRASRASYFLPVQASHQTVAGPPNGLSSRMSRCQATRWGRIYFSWHRRRTGAAAKASHCGVSCWCHHYSQG